MRDEPENVRRDWRIPDELWERIHPLLPPRKPHPLGCHRPRVNDRQAMDAIFFVLRTGCQWNALQDTGLCSSSSAHRRLQERAAAGVFLAFWEQGLAIYEALQGIDWEWLAMDGAMTKAPLGGKKVGKNPTDRGKIGTKRSVLTDGDGVPIGLAVEGANRNDFKMVYETLTSIPVERPMPTPEKPQGMCLDKVRLQAQHEAIQAARQRQETAEFKTQYAQRAGVEGTHAQGIRRCGLRQSRYLGLAKTHLQHLCTAVALNVVRLGEWWRGTPQAKTRCSPFAALRVVAA